jgi:hypothetical protein
VVTFTLSRKMFFLLFLPHHHRFSLRICGVGIGGFGFGGLGFGGFGFS